MRRVYRLRLSAQGRVVEEAFLECVAPMFRDVLLDGVTRCATPALDVELVELDPATRRPLALATPPRRTDAIGRALDELLGDLR